MQGFPWNHKRVYRICNDLALNLRIKPRLRLYRHKPEPLKAPLKPDQVWSVDFMHDQLSDGRCYQLLNVIDDYRSEGLAIERPASRYRPNGLFGSWSSCWNGGKKPL